MVYFKKFKWFTLVELIVVITILAILWTIGFISFLWYTLKSRNSVRIADINSIQKALEVYKIPTGFYPNPSLWLQITYSGSEVWTQGSFWDSVVRLLGRLDKTPIDPLTQKEYTYSILNTNAEYQIAAIIEWETAFWWNIINKTYAWTKQIAEAYVKWTYNWLVAKVATGSLTYVLAVPTIISWDMTLTDIIELQENNKLVYNWFNNLPSSYTDTTLEVNWWWFTFNPNNIILYSWSINELSTDSTKLSEFTQKLQEVYETSQLSSEWNYKSVLDINTGNINEITFYAWEIVNEHLNWKVQIPTTITKEVVNQNSCESAWWYWVNQNNDVFIWTTRWNGYCISPRYWDWNSDTDSWSWWISFNGWGDNSTSYYRWWPSWTYKDAWLSSTNWQTRTLAGLDSSWNLAWYTCKPVWIASSDFDNTDWKGDTIHNRMKWLAWVWNNYNDSQNIDWITWITPLNGHPIPALIIADCIDWKRDIWSNILYKHNDNSVELISYNDYNLDRLSWDQSAIYPWCDNTNIYYPDPDCIIFQNRLKYLLWWTQERGSHLPSIYSYIENNTTTNDSKWEYQLACEQWKFLDWTDSTAWERIWTASLWTTSWYYWIYKWRVIWRRSCTSTTYWYSGSRRGYQSARFVYRP